MAICPASRSCLSSFRQELRQAWESGGHRSQLLQLQEGINIPAAFPVHLPAPQVRYTSTQALQFTNISQCSSFHLGHTRITPQQRQGTEMLPDI